MTTRWSHDPLHCNAHRLTQYRFRLVPVRSPLLGESLLFSFPQVLRCFSSPGWLQHTYVFSVWWPALFTGAGFPIRTSTDQSCVAAPRSLSQLPTSFIASWYQGIHRLLLVTYPHFPKGACFIHEPTTLASTSLRGPLRHAEVRLSASLGCRTCLCDSGCLHSKCRWR